MKILGIETSCDETAVALVDDGERVVGERVASQIALHAPYGGVVPEIASRRHLETLFSLLSELDLKTIGPSVDGIAVTHRPGLIGSLLVGLSAAKGLALAWRRPLVGVDHIHAHAYSTIMGHADARLPAATLVASGGHTSLFLMRSPLELELVGETVDDAAGEAFDKVSSLLGLGYPGGPPIDRIAREGNPRAHRFPRGTVKRAPYDFSFSGLKTAVLYHLRGQDGKRSPRALTTEETADVAASFQEAVVDSLLHRLTRLARETDAKSLGIGGGVACNSRLRWRAQEEADKIGLPLYLSPRELSTDNAVMIAGLGYHLLNDRGADSLDIDARAH